MCYAFIYLLSNMDAWLRTGLNKEPSCIHRLVDPSDFFVPHSIQAILLHLHLYWMQNPSRFLLKCAVHDWDLWSLLGQRYKGKFQVLTAQIYFFLHTSSFSKGGPGAAVEPTVCNRKVPGSSTSLCTFVWVRLGGLKTTLPQTPHSAGSLRHWVRFFFDSRIFSRMCDE